MSHNCTIAVFCAVIQDGMILDAMKVRLRPGDRGILEARLRAATTEQRQLLRMRIVLEAAEGHARELYDLTPRLSRIGDREIWKPRPLCSWAPRHMPIHGCGSKAATSTKRRSSIAAAPWAPPLYEICA